NGVPQARIPVRVETSSGQVVTSSTTDEKGRYRIEGIPAGSYYISGGFNFQLTYFPGRMSKNDASLVTVRPGSDLLSMDFKMATSLGVSVSGRVTTPNGGQVPSRAILNQINSIPLEPTSLTPIQPDGTFKFTNVLPG